MNVPTVVVIGSGFGGPAAVRQLHRAPVEVIVIDRHNHHLFQPLLYQVAAAILSPGEIAPPIRAIVADQANTTVMLGEVDGIDVAQSTVTLTGVDGERRDIGFDYPVVAAGADPDYFGHDEWVRHLFPMKTINQALALHSRILDAYEVAVEESDPVRRDAWTTFAIVGGGPTGVELAGELAAMAHQIHGDFHSANVLRPQVVLIDAGSDLLASFPPCLRKYAKLRLAKMGVEIRLARRVISVDEHGIDLGTSGEIPERIDARERVILSDSPIRAIRATATDTGNPSSQDA